MSSSQLDLYALLGVDPTATAEQISHAYRALLRRHHPDTRTAMPTEQAGADDARLQHVLAAYAVLRDPAQRARYDRNRDSNPPPDPDRDQLNLARSTPDAVVIGTVSRPRPPWIGTVTTTPTKTNTPNTPTPSELLELLRDLLA